MPFADINKFTTFNDFHNAAQGGLHSKHDDVHIFRFADLNKTVVKHMPLFRTSFYQIGLMRKADFSMSVFEHEYRLENQFALILFKPGQLIQFKSDPKWEGYVILFKDSLLTIRQENEAALKRFAVLDPTKDSFIIVDEENFDDLSEVYEKMLYEYEKPLQNSVPIIELYLHVLFHKVNHLYEKLRTQEPIFSTRKASVTFQFKNLVNQKLRETKTIADYADMLHVTPKYLIEALKETSHIAPRTL